MPRRAENNSCSDQARFNIRAISRVVGAVFMAPLTGNAAICEYDGVTGQRELGPNPFPSDNLRNNRVSVQLKPSERKVGGKTKTPHRTCDDQNISLERCT